MDKKIHEMAAVWLSKNFHPATDTLFRLYIRFLNGTITELKIHSRSQELAFQKNEEQRLLWGNITPSCECYSGALMKRKGQEFEGDMLAFGETTPDSGVLNAEKTFGKMHEYPHNNNETTFTIWLRYGKETFEETVFLAIEKAVLNREKDLWNSIGDYLDSAKIVLDNLGEGKKDIKKTEIAEKIKTMLADISAFR